jgi:hypothetical protein
VEVCGTTGTSTTTHVGTFLHNGLEGPTSASMVKIYKNRRTRSIDTVQSLSSVAFCGAHSRRFYFAARWSNASSQYHKAYFFNTNPM